MDTDCGILYFKDETKIYRLHVEFEKNSLQIELEDFVDWVVYSGKFSDEDIGKSIDKRLELSDIYDAFILARTQELVMKDEEIQSCSVRPYQYGQIVNCGEIPCFKIEKGGKIVIYVSLTKSTTKKQFKCQSILSLTKKNNMTETNIITQKSMSQMREQRDFFYKLVNQMKDQFSSQLQHLKEENQVLKQKKKVMEDQINQLSQFYHHKAEALGRENQSLKDSISSLTNQLRDFRKNSQDRYFYLRNSLYLYPLQPFITKFKVSFNLIQMISDNGSWTHLFFNQVIGFDNEYKFKLKVVKTASKNIMIGVVDEPKQINARTSYSSNNAVCYYGNNGYKYPNGGNEGTGFGAGDTIQTIIDRNNKTIKWNISGVTQATFISEIIGDRSRVLRPYFQMYNINDIVEIIF